jgi:hypothetical protein
MTLRIDLTISPHDLISQTIEDFKNFNLKIDGASSGLMSVSHLSSHKYTVSQNSRPREKRRNPHQKTNKNSQRKKFVASTIFKIIVICITRPETARLRA